MSGLDWKNKNWKFKLGLLMVLISLIFFALLVLIPMLDIKREEKIWYTSLSFITAEVLFYTGGFLLGKEMFNKYKSYINPKKWIKSLGCGKSKKSPRR